MEGEYEGCHRDKEKQPIKQLRFKRSAHSMKISESSLSSSELRIQLTGTGVTGRQGLRSLAFHLGLASIERWTHLVGVRSGDPERPGMGMPQPG